MQTQPSSGSRARTASSFALLAYFVGLCAMVMVIAGAWAAWQRRQIMSTWPTTAATIRECMLHRRYPFQRDGGGVSFHVACDVAYANDGGRTVRVESKSRHAGRSGAIYTFGFGGVTTEYPERVLSQWIRRHPSGTTLLLHRDPVSGAITFVGVDSIIDVNPVPGYSSGVVVFAVLALALALTSRYLLRRADRRTYSRPDLPV